MNAVLTACMTILLGSSPVASAISGSAGRQRTLWDFQWQFHRGEAAGAEKPQFSAGGWRTIDLPHDWSIERVPGSPSLFDPKCPSGSGGGFLPGGIGWYRKTFTLPADRAGPAVFVEFEGVYMDSDVWLNGRHLGHHPYGYTSFEYDLTPNLKWDGPNVLAVRVNVEQPCSRWYSGAGIYRHVWLTSTTQCTWRTGEPTSPRRIFRMPTATVQRADPRGQSMRPAPGVVLRTRILDADGERGWPGRVGRRIDVRRKRNGRFRPIVQVSAPHRWSLEIPYLYTAVSEVLVGGKVVDSYRTPFGIRTIEFTKDRGLLLNGKHVQVQGVCDHHDQGCLGAAAYDRADRAAGGDPQGDGLQRHPHQPQSARPQAAGSLRPPGHAGDGRGLRRMEEEQDRQRLRPLLRRLERARPAEHAPARPQSPLRGAVEHRQRDRRTGRPASKGGNIARRLADICRQEDPTRPVTSACNNPAGAVKTGYADALDVFGINYNINQYDTWKGQRKLIGSETSSTVSTRGEYNLTHRRGPVRDRAAA